MLNTCKELEGILKQILSHLEKGDFLLLPPLLKRRGILMEAITKSAPEKTQALETRRALLNILNLERHITALAKDRKQKLSQEIKTIRRQKKALNAYGNQSGRRV